MAGPDKPQGMSSALIKYLQDQQENNNAKSGGAIGGGGKEGMGAELGVGHKMNGGLFNHQSIDLPIATMDQMFEGLNREAAFHKNPFELGNLQPFQGLKETGMWLCQEFQPIGNTELGKFSSPAATFNVPEAINARGGGKGGH